MGSPNLFNMEFEFEWGGGNLWGLQWAHSGQVQMTSDLDMS